MIPDYKRQILDLDSEVSKNIMQKMKTQDFPNPPIQIVGVPPLAEFGFNNYLAAFLKLHKVFTLHQQMRFSFELNAGTAYHQRKEYTYYLYELQNLAFNEVLTVLATYNIPDFHRNLYDVTLYNGGQYFNGILDILKILEDYKK